MKATFWQAETYKNGELHSISFPRRDTKEEAILDAEAALSERDDFDKRHITAAVCEWQDDGNDGRTNTGRYEEVTI